MESKHNLYQYLNDAFNEAGYNSSANDSNFEFLPLNLKIVPEVIKINSFDNGQYSCSSQLTFSHPVFFKEGLTELSMGIGDSEYAAIKSSFNRWIDSDFPPIHDYISKEHSHLGYKTEIASHSGELNEHLGWDIYHGPLLETQETGSEILTEIKENEKSLMLQTIFQPLVDDILGKPGVYFIRCFMSKSANNEINSDCRVNGHDWSHGNEYLNQYISNLSIQDQLYFLKQSLLVASKPIEEIKSKSVLEGLEIELNKNHIEGKKKWWELWKN